MIVNAESQLQLRVVPAYGYLIWLRQEKQASFKMPVLAGVSGSPAAVDVYSFSLQEFQGRHVLD